MKRTLKKAFALACAAVMSIGMATTASAFLDTQGADIVLDGAGDTQAALQKLMDPGDKGDYKYLGWAYIGDSDPSYRYLKLTYKGSDAAFKQIRLQAVYPDGDPNGAGILGEIVWFGENPEGTFKTVEGKNCPDCKENEETTVWIDLKASGFDISQGLRAFHIHTSPKLGTVEFTEAVLSKEYPGITDDEIAENEDWTTEEVTTRAAVYEDIYPGYGQEAEGAKSSNNIIPIVAASAAAVLVVIVASLIATGKKKDKKAADDTTETK